MERARKHPERASEAARCTAPASNHQANPAIQGIAATLNSSPAMVAQRRKLQGLFGEAVQLQAEEEPLQGKVDNIQQEANGMVVQRAMPTLEQFKEQTNAGLFATRDDLLKQIDKALERCNIGKYDTDMKALRYERGEMKDNALIAFMMIDFPRYHKDLDGLIGKINEWRATFAQDDSQKVKLRRVALEKLLAEVMAERRKTLKEKSVDAAPIREKQEAEEAKRVAENAEKLRQQEEAEKAELQLYTAEKFKEKARIGFLRSRIGGVGDVVQALESYHALPERPGIDYMRRSKILAIHQLMSLIADAREPIIKLRDHPGYEKGHLEMEREAHAALFDALNKLNEQCVLERKRLLTQEEYDDLGKRIKGKTYSHEMSEERDKWQEEVETPVAKEGTGDDEGWVDFA